MPNSTPNYGWNLPLVNNATDADLWGGQLNSNWSDLDTELKTVSDAIQLPVGSVYINYSDNTNPATLLGYGTWTSLQNRFLIGAGGTYSAGSTGGATTHTLTANEIPSITSSVGLFGSTAGGGTAYINNTTAGGSTNGTCTGITSTNTGGAAHSILNPYVAVYMWYRSA